jgi:hypothetical protein
MKEPMIEPDNLPSEMTVGATLGGNEYGWRIDSFPGAVAKAEAFGFACLGGQFQFRLATGTCEMYWLNADSRERERNETWIDFCHRSCAEVSSGFDKLLAETDFDEKAVEWPVVQEAMAQGIDPKQFLVFVAYFVDETEYVNLKSKAQQLEKRTCNPVTK